MNYSDLVNAIKEGDNRTIEKYSRKLVPILRNSLIGRMGASREDAEDAVQNMFVYLIPRIEENKIETPAGLLNYMQVASKHCYLNLVRSKRRERLTYLSEEPAVSPDQIWNLIDEEKENQLRKCISEMSGRLKSYVLFLLEFPDASPEDTAEYFKITLNNVWIRKHRAINQLRQCLEKFSHEIENIL